MVVVVVVVVVAAAVRCCPKPVTPLTSAGRQVNCFQEPFLGSSFEPDNERRTRTRSFGLQPPEVELSPDFRAKFLANPKRWAIFTSSLEIHTMSTRPAQPRKSSSICWRQHLTHLGRKFSPSIALFQLLVGRPVPLGRVQCFVCANERPAFCR